jgi:hypothetical protein
VAYDAVQAVRAVRDEVSSTIAAMSFEEENRLRRLMELAAQQRAEADTK